MAAIAFALRHGPTVVPLEDETADEVGSEPESDEADEAVVASAGNGDRAWVYRDGPSGEPVLLLFSDARFRPPAVPVGAALASPAWLRGFLDARGAEIGAVFLDFAGPHPLRATPADLIAALDA